MASAAVEILIQKPFVDVGQCRLDVGLLMQAIKILNMIKVYGKPIRVNKASQDKKQMDVGANLFIGNLDPDVDEKVQAFAKCRLTWAPSILRNLLLHFRCMRWIFPFSLCPANAACPGGKFSSIASDPLV